MLEGPKPAKQTEFNTVVDFLNENLRPEKKWSIDAEYPTAINLHNSPNMQIITDNGKIVSHALTRDLMIKSPISLFKVATIGSVVTHEEYRKQGLSTKIVQKCLEAAAGKACDFAVLWTNLHDFYAKMGFVLAGSEISYVLNNKLPQGAEPLKFIDGNKISPQALVDLYNKHTVTSLRNASEVQKYLSIPDMRVHTAWDQQSKLRAYAVEGKGLDLTGYIHEWGGNVTDLMSLISHMQEQQQQNYTLIAPMHSQNLHRQLQGLGFKPHHGFLGMFKILNAKSLFLKISNYARAVGLSEFVLEVCGDDEFVIGRKGKTFKTESLTDMTQIIFGPHQPQLLKDFDSETRQLLEKLLPLPMWIWGWDSV